MAAFIWKTPKTSCVPVQINLNSGASNPEPEPVSTLLLPDETNFFENDKGATWNTTGHDTQQEEEYHLA